MKFYNDRMWVSGQAATLHLKDLRVAAKVIGPHRRYNLGKVLERRSRRSCTLVVQNNQAVQSYGSLRRIVDLS